MLGNFSLSNLFYSFDVDILAYIAIFFLLFAGITFLLKRTLFKDSRGVLIAISASSSLLAMYGLIRANFSIAELFFKLNLPPELQYNLAWIIFILVFLILWMRTDLGITLMLTGLMFFLVGALKLVYADLLVEIVGGIMVVAGYFLHKRIIYKRELKDMNLKERQEYKEKKSARRQARFDKWRNIGNRTNNPKKNNPRPTRQRSNRELQRKYDFYAGKIKRIQRENKGKIPKKGTKEGHKRHRSIQAMKAIENSARKKGFKLR